MSLPGVKSMLLRSGTDGRASVLELVEKQFLSAMMGGNFDTQDLLGTTCGGRDGDATEGEGLPRDEGVGDKKACKGKDESSGA